MAGKVTKTFFSLIRKIRQCLVREKCKKQHKKHQVYFSIYLFEENIKKNSFGKIKTVLKRFF